MCKCGKCNIFTDGRNGCWFDSEFLFSSSTDLFTFQPSILASSADRLKAISKSVKPFKFFKSVPVINHWMENLLTLLPVQILELVYHHYHVTLCMTSVPGSMTEQDVFGNAKVVECIPALGHLRTSMGMIFKIES